MILVWFLASVVYRRWAGKDVFARTRTDAVFVERWASARAGTGLMARLSTAKNCLHVQITSTELRLTPHFPISLGFLPEIYGYDQVVARREIRSVTVVGGLVRKMVEIKYGGQGSATAGVLLVLLKHSDEFVTLLSSRPSQLADEPQPTTGG